MNFPAKIAILGVGLIGGSIALGLKKRLGSKVTILGACSTFKRANIAIDRGIIDIAVDSPQKLPQSVSLIILSAPISANIKLLKSLKLLNSLIIDVSSTKEAIYKDLPQNIRFIGTHPMAGGERTGFEEANPDLFVGKPWIICQSHQTSPTDSQIVSDLISILGAKKIVMTSRIHDQLAGLVSHLPLLISQTLLTVAQKNKNWHQAKLVAGTGFRDMTRLASHSHSLKKDIIKTNRINVLKHLLLFKKELEFQISIIKGL